MKWYAYHDKVTGKCDGFVSDDSGGFDLKALKKIRDVYEIIRQPVGDEDYDATTKKVVDKNRVEVIR